MLSATSFADAFAVAKRIIPDCEKDENASARAGYPVYRSASEFYSYICDLGSRLEINLADNTTINIIVR